MTQAKDNGGPAFPTENERQTGPNAYHYEGMTLRDYFAVHASAEDVKAQIEIIRAAQIKKNGIGVLPDGWSAAARYMHADTMLKARAATGDSEVK